MLIPRAAEETVRQLARGYPVVAITGPRQSGKTTLGRRVFPEKAYVSLEDPDLREFATADPRGFLSRYPDGALVDEAQRCPPLFSYLQGRVDAASRMGLYILTGSQMFDLMTGITQSLAGRVAMLTLLPFTLSELRSGGRAPASVEDLMFQGLYPPLHDRGLDPRIWYANYVATYVERDVRRLVNVRELGSFQRFVRMCAARSGQLLNLSALANDCGITHNTARAWLTVLEASYLVHQLPPHHRNFDKRLVKTPKLYFLDPGLAAWLCGIQHPDQLATHPQRGALFETWVVSELLKSRYNRALGSNLYFWRDRTGHEVDVLIDQGDALWPLEIKSGQTAARDYLTGLEYWQRLAGAMSGPPRLVYGGDQRLARADCDIVPWREVDTIQP